MIRGSGGNAAAGTRSAVNVVGVGNDNHEKDNNNHDKENRDKDIGDDVVVINVIGKSTKKGQRTG